MIHSFSSDELELEKVTHPESSALYCFNFFLSGERGMSSFHVIICFISFLQGTVILTFLSVPDREKLLNCSIDGLELFSCSLSNEDETALSILDPVTIALEVKPPEPVLTKSNKNNRSKASFGPQEQVFGVRESFWFLLNFFPSFS